MTTLTSVAAVAAQTLANMTKGSQILSAATSQPSNTDKKLVQNDIFFQDNDAAKKNGLPSLGIDSLLPKHSQLCFPLTSGIKAIPEQNSEAQHITNVLTTKGNSVPKTTTSDGSVIDASDDGLLAMKDNRNEDESADFGQNNNISTGTLKFVCIRKKRECVHE